MTIWALGKVLPRPFTFNLAVPFRAFTRSVAAVLRRICTPPALKTLPSPRDLYESINFQITIFGCARSSGQPQGPGSTKANFENARNAESYECHCALCHWPGGCPPPAARKGPCEGRPPI